MTYMRKRERLTARTTSRGDARPPTAEQTLFVAVVHAVDGIRFVAAEPTRRELVKRLSEYVRRHGDHVLQPDHARHLRGLLARRELEAAVELYFGLVGGRWDEEWLVTAVVNTGDRRDIAAVVGEVALADALGTRHRLRDAS